MEWPFADPRDGGRNIIATIQVPIRRPNHTARRGRSPEAHRRGGACRAGAHPAILSLHSTALRRDRAAWRIGQRQFGGLAVHAAMRWLEGAGTPQDGARAARKGRDAPSGPGPGAHCRRRLRTIAPRLRPEPERAAQTRRRGAGDSESANRRAAPKGAAPKGAASRTASGPRRGADPARGFPDTDRRRILRARMSDHGPQAGGA